MQKNTHTIYMKRCLELAKLGQGKVFPNPMVGAVIVCNGRVIGEGFHQEFGGAHAEVNAINAVANKELISDSTMYVSLEPCSHHGKTPPCAHLLVASKIKKVVIATLDQNPIVRGNGVQCLKNAGIEVLVGIMENEANELNQTFNFIQKHKHPFYALKWAESLDGFMDKKRRSNTQGPTKISNSVSSRWVHQQRSYFQGILIGKNTAILDSPALTTRNWPGNNPIRIIIDQNLEIPPKNSVFDSQAPTIVLNAIKSETQNNIQFQKINFDDFLNNLDQFLLEKNIFSVLVEGGTKTLQHFLDCNHWSIAFKIKSSTPIKEGVAAPNLIHPVKKSFPLLSDTIYYYENN